MAAGLCAMPFLAQVPFVAAVLVAAAGNGVVTATTASLLAAAGPPEHLGARMGQGQSAASAARATGPLAAGALFAAAAAAPYLLGGALSIGVAFLVTRHGTRTTAHDSEAHEPHH